MANILFKRGVHAQLPTTAVDGAFYLTTDSHRLYAGIGTDLVDLNQYINVVNTLDGATNSLASLTNVQLGDFAYVKTGNILAVYQEVKEGNNTVNKWVQINVNDDTTNASIAFSGTGDTDDATLKITLKDSEGHDVEDTIKFVGTQGTDVSIDADGNITIQGCTYTVSGKATTVGTDVTKYEIELTPSDDEVAGSKVALVPGANITFTDNGNNTLTISTHDATELASADVTVNGENVSITVTDSKGSTVTDTAESAIYMTYGKNGTSRASNQGKMDVYTVSEVDALFNKLDGLTYKGTVADLAALKAITAPSVGDIYMASGSFAITDAIIATDIGHDGQCEIGDLFIAKGEETNGVISKNLKWTYVPSGNDLDTTYKVVVDANAHKLSIINIPTGDPIGSIDIDSGATGKIVLTGSADANNENLGLTIEHAAVTRKDGTEEAVSNQTTVTAVVGVTTDSTGHVSGIKTQNIGIMGYQLSGATVSAADNVATVVDTLKDTAGDGAGTSTFKIDASASDNLNVTANGTSIVMKLEWGTF